jgi:hypothetical protein
VTPAAELDVLDRSRPTRSVRVYVVKLEEAAILAAPPVGRDERASPKVA